MTQAPTGTGIRYLSDKLIALCYSACWSWHRIRDSETQLVFSVSVLFGVMDWKYNNNYNNNNNNNMDLQQTDLHFLILDSWTPLDPLPL